jgi:hypothetical protein
VGLKGSIIMKTRLLIPILGMCAALSAQANPQQPLEQGEIILEQYTRVKLEDGKPVKTQRGMKVKMRDPNGVVWELLPTAQWTLTKGDEFAVVDPMKWNQGPTIMPGDPPREESGHDTKKLIDHALLGKKVEDGITIAGEWQTYQLGPTRTRAAWVERIEMWWRADRRDDGTMQPRVHRKIRTSPYEKYTLDVFYLATDRLHPSLFSAEDNPEP